MHSFFNEIASRHDLNFLSEKPLSGGDINDVFMLKCAEGNFVAKINKTDKFPNMFKAEAKGLSLLKSSKSFRIPEIVGTGNIENSSYLLMEYIPAGQPSHDFWKVFAVKLSSLHKSTNDSFGLNYDNYIGSLPQQNNWCNSASEFYISQRLEPQFKIAIDNGYYFNKLDLFFKNIVNEIPNESPSLIHGDLWSGNYLALKNGQPALIDPAIAYAPREMDIAMMKLFGGFPEETFTHYNTSFPLIEGWAQRISLWQLFYLLVHLNLFGRSYLPQVKNIVTQFL